LSSYIIVVGLEKELLYNMGYLDYQQESIIETASRHNKREVTGKWIILFQYAFSNRALSILEICNPSFPRHLSCQRHGGSALVKMSTVIFVVGTCRNSNVPNVTLSRTKWHRTSPSSEHDKGSDAIYNTPRLSTEKFGR